MSHCSFCEMTEAQAIEAEQNRIIKYLDRTYDWNGSVEFDRDELIAIIKGENNE